MGDNLWQMTLEPYARRAMYRCGVLLMGCVQLTAERILCVDDAVLWSMGYEHRVNEEEGREPAA